MRVSVAETPARNKDVPWFRQLGEAWIYLFQEVALQDLRIGFARLHELVRKHRTIKRQAVPYLPAASSEDESSGFTYHQFNSRGSVILPITAEAAAMAALPRKISARGLPIRPGSFLVIAATHTSPSA